MFERYTEAARAAVVDAQEQARTLHHDEILAEHLLLAVRAAQGSISAQVLAEQGVRPEQLIRELIASGTAAPDTLRAIGIDLTAVREQAEAVFGSGALERPRQRRVGLLRTVVSTGGQLPFSAAARRALDQSLQEMLVLGHDHVTVDHLLLGLLAREQDPAAQTLQRLMVNTADVRAQVRSRLSRAA